MAADWEEIRRLAADFQRAQFADTIQRLSERNCIEIVAKLIEDKQLDVVHTLDGKEYITPAQISREIRDELYVRGGRVNIVDLQQVINVDLVHVESRANDIAKSDRNTQLVLGQLIDETYLDRLAEEVNDKLQEIGQIHVAELCKTYDLPGDFLTEVLSQRLGRIIQGQMDEYNRGVIFTQTFLARHRARICGLFSAMTRPTQLNHLINLYGFQEHLLYSVLEELVNSGRLRGSVVGGRQDKAVFIPDIYSKTQSSWVDSFLEQNRYLEFDALNRLGIPDPVSYIRKRFRGRKLLFLQASCVDQAIIQQVEASVEEAVNSGTWIDVQPLLPSCLSSEDVAILVNEVMRTANVQSSARLLCGTVVVSEKFISSCLPLFQQSMQQKAQTEIKNNPVFLISEDDLKQNPTLADAAPPGKKDRKEDRRKKAAEGSGSTKAGGGGNAREIRIRKTKKKGRRDEDSDEEAATAPQGRNKQAEVPFMSHEQVEAVLQEQVCDCPEEMISELAEHILRPLTRLYQEVVLAACLSSSGAGTGAGRKQNVKELQEEISNLYNNIRLFEKGAKSFPDETQTSIAKHVLKTVCTDMTNILLTFAAAEFMSAVESPGSVTNEVRMKILGKLPEDTKAPLMKLHNSLNGRNIEEFLTHLEPSVEVCGFMLKKGDKKRERQALFQHRQALTEQLKQTEEPALVLHLTSVLLFQLSSQCALHVPGRCVPQIISALAGRIPEDQHRLLSQYQALVVKQLVGHSRKLPQGEMEGDSGSPHGDDMDAVRKELLSLTNEVKDLVLLPRKTSVTED
ncbi:LOW QUALITY PROTEIN: E3 UFM1-protein ligase 1 [Brienomyrus brachyistius]|uniref:LOW QUALITY PROTEIN: E3 UFM1-protein ligase 1 n=1 Tax=Brienomyrus brachyistius TaxID=42636 RepID=UPI0020B3C71D|nr:LOW QUALITY PROTEIN: E3 UFM1-protein ligase 1 [Brienomyrus brachyistius]